MTPSLDTVIHSPETPHARWYLEMVSSGDYVQQFDAGDQVIVSETGAVVRIDAVHYILNTFKYWYQIGDIYYLAGALTSAENDNENEQKHSN